MAKGDGRDSRPLRNKHHIFFPKKIWLASGEEAVELRYLPWCIVEVPVDLHEALHRQSPEVPVPNKKAIELIIFQLDRLKKHGEINRRTSLERRLELLVWMANRVEPAMGDALQAQLDAVRELTGSLG